MNYKPNNFFFCEDTANHGRSTLLTFKAAEDCVMFKCREYVFFTKIKLQPKLHEIREIFVFLLITNAGS